MHAASISIIDRGYCRSQEHLHIRQRRNYIRQQTETGGNMPVVGVKFESPQITSLNSLDSLKMQQAVAAQKQVENKQPVAQAQWRWVSLPCHAAHTPVWL